MNKEWVSVERKLKDGAIDCRTVKLTISGHDLYFKIGYESRRPVYVDITLGQDAVFIRNHEVRCPGCDKEYLNPEANDLATQIVTGTRAHLEVTGRMATSMLQSNVWTLDNLIDMWKATRFEPSGLCLQVQAVDPETGKEIDGSASIVSSPLDAFARYAEVHREEWDKKLSVPPPPLQ